MKYKITNKKILFSLGYLNFYEYQCIEFICYMGIKD